MPLEPVADTLPMDAYKQPCRVATTATIALSGLQTVDGVALAEGDRVLVTTHSTDGLRGIWVASSGAWTRATDFDTSAKARPGSLVVVAEGTANKGTLWVLTNDTVALGSTGLDFALVNPPYTSAATALQLAQRDSSGRISVATPSLSGHAATKGYVDTAVADLQAQSASIEDLVTSCYREITISPTAGNTTIPLMAAPFPMRVTSLSLVSFAVHTLAASDTAWWLTRLRYTRAGNTTNIATKTTRSTAGTEPAGEALVGTRPWKYDASTLGVSLHADDVLSMIFAPQNNPANIVGPLTFTLGYAPL